MFRCYGTDKGFIKVSNKDSLFSIALYTALDSHKQFHLGADSYMADGRRAIRLNTLWNKVYNTVQSIHQCSSLLLTLDFMCNLNKSLMLMDLSERQLCNALDTELA